MNEKQREHLRKLRVEIANDLEPKDILNELFEDGILSENDHERISESKTRKERCQLLLSLLPTRGPTAYGSFQKALNKNPYTHLGTRLKQLPEENENLNSNTNVEQQNNPCKKCCPFIPKFNSDSSYVSNLLKRHCCLVYDIEPVDLLDFLFKEHLLEEDDFDRVRSGVTRRDRCMLLFSALDKTASDNAYSVFKRSLVKKYSFIKEKLDADDYESNAAGITLSKPELEHGSASSLPIETLTTEIDGNRDGNSCSVDFDNISNEPFLSKSRRHAATYSSSSNRKKKVKKQRKSRQETGSVSLDVVPANPVNSSSRGIQSKMLHATFDFLSTLINQGKYDTFESMTSQLRLRFPNNFDMSCMFSYLQASRCLFEMDTDTAKHHINLALSSAGKTTNPKYFTVELITAKTRRYLALKKYGKLKNTLDDVKMIIESDPLGCTGRAAGWMYLNDGKLNTSIITSINFDRPKALELYRQLFRDAKNSIELALSHFQQDGGKDGPFGFGYGLCRLAVLLLRCGDNGLTMDVLDPSAEDIELAKGYLDQMENLNIRIPKILNAHFLLAKCDYQYRIKNTFRALQHAESALVLSQEINILEFDFKENVKNRITFLKHRKPLEIEEISDVNVLLDLLKIDDQPTEEIDEF